MVFQFSSFRSQICPPQVTKISGNLSTSGTLFLYLQSRNDCGFNLPSSSSQITYSSGDGIEITLPGDCVRDGENVLQYSITANIVDDPSSAVVLVNLDAKQLILPHTFSFTEDSHLLLAASVATLPVGTDRIPGMMRQLSSTGLIYRYVRNSTLPPNNTTVLNADLGNWEYHYDGFSSYVGNTSEDSNGADLNILDILDSRQILQKSYSLDGSAGPSRSYWIRNTTTETVSQGTRVGLTVSVNGEPASEDFESLIKVIFDGHVDPSTGTLDLTLSDGVSLMEDLGIIKDYQFGRTDLILQKPLPPNHAFQITVFPQFNSYELQSVPLAGTSISVLGFFFDEAGSYNDASALIGNIMLPENPNLRRVYPSSGLSIFADEGSGTVGGFFFKDIGSNVVPGLVDSTDNQQIAINNNGSVYLNDSSLESNEDLRALVGTVAGESITSPFSSLGVSGDSSPEISILVTYPNNIDFAYDDVIAGTLGKGTFNAEEIPIYISNGSEIRVFLGLAPTNPISDTFTVSWSSGTVVTSVKTINFGLWSPITPSEITTSTNGSVIYEAAVGFTYLGNSVTRISHKEEDGVIPELALSIAEIAQFAKYWRQPINSYDDLKSIPSGDLLDGQSHRLETSQGFTIWTWDFSSALTGDDTSIITPLDSSGSGRWVLMSGAGGGNVDKIVTFNNQVLVDHLGFVLVSDSGGPITPGSTLDDYLEPNTIGISSPAESSLMSLNEQSNKFQIITSTSPVTLELYNGGFYGREHLIYSKNSTSTINVTYNGDILVILNNEEKANLIWDLTEWILL